MSKISAFQHVINTKILTFFIVFSIHLQKSHVYFTLRVPLNLATKFLSVMESYQSNVLIAKYFILLDFSKLYYKVKSILFQIK